MLKESKMKCPECGHNLRKVKVSVEGAASEVISYQCPKCGYFSFEKESAKKVVEELKKKESPLEIKQRIIKLSKGRLGIYFNRDIARSLDLKAGEEVYVAVPDKKHLVLSIKRSRT